MSATPEATARRAGDAAVGEAVPDWSLESELWSRGLVAVAGLDEAGRGALAGPVVAAVVLLERGHEYPYRDSKCLTRSRRAELAARLRGEALAYAVGHASAVEVDAHNVLGATKLAARRALAQVLDVLDGLVTDYLTLDAGLPEVAVPRADTRSYQVAAASILAKHERDCTLVEMEETYPGYGFDSHAGYGVPRHLAALADLGPCPQHRLSFAPVAAVSLFWGGQGRG